MAEGFQNTQQRTGKFLNAWHPSGKKARMIVNDQGGAATAYRDAIARIKSLQENVAALKQVRRCCCCSKKRQENKALHTESCRAQEAVQTAKTELDAAWSTCASLEQRLEAANCNNAEARKQNKLLEERIEAQGKKQASDMAQRDAEILKEQQKRKALVLENATQRNMLESARKQLRNKSKEKSAA